MVTDIEVWGPGGQVFQAYYENQVFAAGQTRTYTTVWTVPANAPAAVYGVDLGIFSPDWSQNPHWNDTAARITVT
jgi:hypothetical protein